MPCLRKMFLVVVSLVSGHVFAENVLWNFLEDMGYGRIGCYEPNGISIWPDMTFSVIDHPQSVTLVPTNEFVLEFVGTWVVAMFGEIIDESVKQNFDRVFIENTFGETESVHLGDAVDIHKNGSIYMAVSVGEIDFISDPANVARYLYGWVEITVSDAGVVSVGASAIDLDGGPMIVGGGSAIPEPHSGLLLLAGGALLTLRRRRR